MSLVCSDIILAVFFSVSLRGVNNERRCRPAGGSYFLHELRPAPGADLSVPGAQQVTVGGQQAEDGTLVSFGRDRASQTRSQGPRLTANFTLTPLTCEGQDRLATQRGCIGTQRCRQARKQPINSQRYSTAARATGNKAV